MWRNIVKFAPAVGFFSLGVGLQVSDIKVPMLGYVLMIFGALLLTIPGWPLIRRFRVRSPLYFVAKGGVQQTTDYEAEHASQSLNLFSSDFHHPDQYLHVLEHEIDWHKFKTVSPHIVFKFRILSSSVYTLALEERISGRIWCNGVELNDRPDLIGFVPTPPGNSLVRGQPAWLHLRQSLSPSVVEAIRNTRKEGNGIHFGLQDIRIFLQGHPPKGIQAQRFPLVIPYNLQVSPSLTELELA